MAITLRDTTNTFAPLEPGTLINGSRLNIISRTVAPIAPAGYTISDIAPGQPVFQSPTHDRHCSSAFGIGDFLGIAVLDMGSISDPIVPSLGRPTYSPNAEISILTKGDILVIAGSDVSSGSPAYVGAAAGLYSAIITATAPGNLLIPASWALTALRGTVTRLHLGSM